MAINLNQFVEDFKYLDPKDPGTWPAVPKLVSPKNRSVAVPTVPR